MATFTKAALSVPSPERSVRITNVSAGDRIDIQEILGRPARGIKFYVTATTDVVEFRLNNYILLREESWEHGNPVRIWSAAPSHSVFSITGALEHVTEDGLQISSIEIVSLSLSAGSTIELVAF